MKRASWPAILAVLAVAVAACAGRTASSGGAIAGATSTSSEQGSGAASLPDPCSLLTPAQVQAALGVQAGNGSPGSEPHTCVWSHQAGGGSGAAQVTLAVNGTGSIANVCIGESMPAMGITVVQLSGIGDRACYQDTYIQGENTAAILTFARGGQTYSLSASFASPVTPSKAEAAMRALALDVLAHL